MSVEAVKQYLKKWNMDGRVKEFDVSSATVELAALALSCEEARIAKTMSFLVEGKAVLIVMAGDARIDNPKYKAQFHTKAVMLKAEQVEDMTGHPIGGVCPFAVKESARVYLDESLKRFDKVYPAAGSANSAVELTPEELCEYTGFPEWICVTKGWEK